MRIGAANYWNCSRSESAITPRPTFTNAQGRSQVGLFPQRMPRYPYGRHPWQFEYRAEDHDETDKSFLGYTGNFNGEDIIDIILKQPACPRFIARHLYNFFVEDEPQVPAWNIEEPRNPEAVRMLAETLVENNYDVKPVLRALFNSDFFKDARYKKVKIPTEVVVSTLRLTGDLQGPGPAP